MQVNTPPPFFCLHLNLGAKFWTEIELLRLTKLCKNIWPPRNLLDQQKIDAYAKVVPHVPRLNSKFQVSTVPLAVSKLQRFRPLGYRMHNFAQKNTETSDVKRRGSPNNFFRNKKSFIN